MRRVRDRRIEEPYRSWIDRALPLPGDVTLFPRTIEVSFEIARLVYLTPLLVGMGTAFFVLFGTPADLTNPGAVSFLALISLICFGLPLWMVHRLRHTLAARRDQRAGTLRQGLFLGGAGILVRLLPNRCYAVPLGQFVKAEEWSSGGSDAGEDYVRIETRTGQIDLVAHHVTVDAKTLNKAVAALRSRLYREKRTSSQASRA